MDFSTFSPALVLVTVISLALAPFVAVMVTSFTKMVVVLSLLRNALGLQQVPPNVVINGLAIVLSIYVMYPVILDTHAAVNAKMQGLPPPALISAPTRPANAGATPTAPGAAAQAEPAPRSPAAAAGLAAEAAAARGPQFLNVVGSDVAARGPQFANVQGTPSAAPATDAQTTATGEAATPPATAPTPAPSGGRMDTARLLSLVDAGKEPLRAFLTRHSSDDERAFFLRSAQRLLPPARRADLTASDFIVIIPAFTVSELTAAFQIGFLIFLPFLIIDLVVSNILLALGMMMLSPTTVSLPFKLLLFVLIDGWAKLVHGLVLTYA
jgi:type III secretory pathway component EscR